MLRLRAAAKSLSNTNSLSLANFVGRACPANAWVVGFLNVSVIRRMPGSLLLAEADPLKADGISPCSGLLFFIKLVDCLFSIHIIDEVLVLLEHHLALEL